MATRFKLLPLLLATYLILSFNPVSANDEKNFDELSFFGFSEPYLSEKAKRGLQRLYSGDGFHVALPLTVLKELEALNDVTANPLIQEVKTIEGQFRAFGRVPSPPNRIGVPEDFALGLSLFEREHNDRRQSTVGFMNHNCFQCHGGVVAGIVVPGLGNTHVDQVSIRNLGETAIDYYGWSGRTHLSNLEEDVFGEFVEEIKGKIKPTFGSALSRGENYGPYAVWKLLSRFINPSVSGLTAYPVDEASPFDHYIKNDDGTDRSLPPVDPGAWWLTRYKKTNYWYRDPVPYEKKPAHFTINFTSIYENANKDHPGHVDAVGEILDFVYETRSPAYPYRLNYKQVERGRQLFHGEVNTQSGTKMKCAKCHGSYEKVFGFFIPGRPGGYRVKYPEKLINAKTDPAYNDTLRWFQPLVERVDGFGDFFENAKDVPVGSTPPKSGYLAPPLDGVWASAPYFHNGSVPTLTQVLNSKERPTFWQKNYWDPFAYDFEDVGLEHLVMNASDVWRASLGTDLMPVLAKPSIAYRAIYNTTEYGRSNQGHTYGDALTSRERAEVIEFLKSLSGPLMLTE